MILAITGSREGLTLKQRRALVVLIHVWGVTTLVHGDCIGVDAQADAIAAEHGIARFAFPSEVTTTRARCDQRGCVYLAKPGMPLARNGRIVERGDITAAFPRASSRGTWDAVRKSRALGRPTVVIGDDGRAT